MADTSVRPKPALQPEYCKGCGRCIEACARGCLEPGTEIQPLSGLVPVAIHLETCNACGSASMPARSRTGSGVGRERPPRRRRRRSTCRTRCSRSPRRSRSW